MRWRDRAPKRTCARGWTEVTCLCLWDVFFCSEHTLHPSPRFAGTYTTYPLSKCTTHNKRSLSSPLLSSPLCPSSNGTFSSPQKPFCLICYHCHLLPLLQGPVACWCLVHWVAGLSSSSSRSHCWAMGTTSDRCCFLAPFPEAVGVPLLQTGLPLSRGIVAASLYHPPRKRCSLEGVRCFSDA